MKTLDHIGIVVGDLTAAEKWYVNRLDGVVTHREDTYTRIKVANTHIALILEEKYKPHVAILCDKENLPTNGTRVEHRDGTIGVYQEDPWGNSIEFISYDGSCQGIFLEK